MFFNVEIQRLNQYNTQVQDCENKVRNEIPSLNKIGRDIARYSNSYQGVSRYLDSMSENLVFLIERLEGITQSIESITNIYYRTEQAVLNHNSELGSLTNMEGQKSLILLQEILAENEERGDSTDSKPWGSLDIFNKFIKFVHAITGIETKGAQSNVIKNITNLLGFVKDGMKFCNTDGDTSTENYADWLGFIYSGLKLDKSAVQLIEKYTNKNVEGFKSTFMDDYAPMIQGIKILQEIMNDYNDSDGNIVSFFKNSNGITNAIGDLGLDIYIDSLGLSGKEKFMKNFKTSSETVGPIMSLVNMAIYGISDGLEKFNDGITWGEFGEWLEGTGATGANTLIKSFTLGTVDIKTEETLSGFKEAEEFAVDLIDSWNIPTWAKTALCIPASIPVAAYGIAKPIEQFGESIGNGIKSFFHW